MTSNNPTVANALKARNAMDAGSADMWWGTAVLEHKRLVKLLSAAAATAHGIAVQASPETRNVAEFATNPRMTEAAKALGRERELAKMRDDVSFHADRLRMAGRALASLGR